MVTGVLVPAESSSGMSTGAQAANAVCGPTLCPVIREANQSIRTSYWRPGLALTYTALLRSAAHPAAAQSQPSRCAPGTPLPILSLLQAQGYPVRERIPCHPFLEGYLPTVTGLVTQRPILVPHKLLVDTLGPATLRLIPEQGCMARGRKHRHPFPVQFHIHTATNPVRAVTLPPFPFPFLTRPRADTLIILVLRRLSLEQGHRPPLVLVHFLHGGTDPVTHHPSLP
jgi:hypothetical protein